MIDYRSLAVDAAALSPCIKRKVGAVAVGECGYVIGFNHNPEGGPCEDAEGHTVSTVVHAEVDAIKGYKHIYGEWPTEIYVTHLPCTSCLSFIMAAGIKLEGIHLVEQFLKFDSSKPRFDLLPVSAEPFIKKGLFKLYFEAMNSSDNTLLQKLGAKLLKHTSLEEVAKVLAFGAKKYKPNNWRKVDNLDRYWAALGRHLVCFDKNLKSKDSETKLTHAAHAMTNVLFLLELKTPKSSVT